ncbi:MAG: hypothetical protein RJA07_2825 [Bacteroidota bacterium]|jgi:3-deoxy-7-phosphoheptulonate synthase
MILHLKNTVTEPHALAIAHDNKGVAFYEDGRFIIVTTSKDNKPKLEDKEFVDEYFTMESDMQLASKKYKDIVRTVKWNNVEIGGKGYYTAMMAGPCAVENEKQIMKSAEFIASLGIKTFRAGAYKPRTSPYTFQGLGQEGLELLAEVRRKYGLSIITEVKNLSHAKQVIETADIIQIGAKAMYDVSVLEMCGESGKPILIKRGFGTTLQEFVQAAEFVLCKGNPNVILCERGIRTFETKTRFTFDLCGAAYLKHHTNLPIVLDPSHAMGYDYGVPDLAKASIAFGCDGLLIEVHPTPKQAWSDASQQLDFDTFRKLMTDLQIVGGAVGKKIV